MPRRSILPPVIVAGLFLSIPLKAWTIASAHVGTGLAPESMLARTLDDMGFQTRREERLLGRPAVVASESEGACVIWMGIVSGEGWHRDIVVSSTPRTAEAVFFFKGRFYADQPVWATWLDEKLSVLARSFAIPLQGSPVVAAHIGRGCRVDLARLAERLRQF